MENNAYTIEVWEHRVAEALLVRLPYPGDGNCVSVWDRTGGLSLGSVRDGLKDQIGAISRGRNNRCGWIRRPGWRYAT